jgi:lipoprotein-anchoring transpeptidase ErfK/SrfK
MFKLDKKSFLILLLGSLIVLIMAPWLIKGETQNNKVSEVKDWSGKIDLTQKKAYFEEQEIIIPEIALKETKSPVLGVSDQERYIEVDLSDQKLTAWEGNQIFLESLVSTGLPWWPTPTGEFRIWAKARATKMEGGEGRYYYYLPNVPYVMFFENSRVPGWRGFSLHGTYWHNDFGKVHSHGCVNLPTPVAQRLYYWTSPTTPEGHSFIRTTESNPGTRIVIHE